LIFVVVAVSRQKRQTSSAISASRGSFFTHHSHSKHPLHTTTHNILEKTYMEHVLQAYNVLHHTLQTTKSGLGMPCLIWSVLPKQSRVARSTSTIKIAYFYHHHHVPIKTIFFLPLLVAIFAPMRFSLAHSTPVMSFNQTGGW
jgi:hypothetical protein